MGKSFISVVGLAVFLIPLLGRGLSEIPIVPLSNFGVAHGAGTMPLPPNASVAAPGPGELAQTEEEPLIAVTEIKKSTFAISKPARLIIPSIGLDADVLSVGQNDKGEMDVPSGKSDDVGWYKYGTMPGKIGSAVIDAHVYAAFSQLKYLPVGGDVYVVTMDGTKLHFVVADSRVYELSELSSKMLFGRKDAKRLNLITCAGAFVQSMGTYSHRLVVYTTFVGAV